MTTTNPFEALDSRLNVIEDLLAKITHQLPDKTGVPLNDIGGLTMAMEITGLSRSGVYGKVHRREIPHTKRGKRLYFSRRELVEWLTENRRDVRGEGN